MSGSAGGGGMIWRFQVINGTHCVTLVSLEHDYAVDCIDAA